MMFNIRGIKMEITEAMRDYAENKISKVSKYLENTEKITVNVVVSSEKIGQKIEVTIPVKSLILRGEERNKDYYAAVDLVADKIERQIIKNKKRLNHKNNKQHRASFNLDLETENNVDSNIVKRKTVFTKPMSEEEAILQMELLNHDFFVFKNIDTSNVSVLYKRKDGNFGILETE